MVDRPIRLRPSLDCRDVRTSQLLSGQRQCGSRDTGMLGGWAQLASKPPRPHMRGRLTLLYDPDYAYNSLNKANLTTKLPVLLASFTLAVDSFALFRLLET